MASNILNNLTTIGSDSTTSYFNNFNSPTINVSQNVDEAIIGFFEQLTQTKGSAKALAGAVIYTAQAQNIDPMAILHEFTKLSKGELNNYLVMFLNLNRVGTSLLGLSNTATTNKYISRTILV